MAKQTEKPAVADSTPKSIEASSVANAKVSLDNTDIRENTAKLVDQVQPTKRKYTRRNVDKQAEAPPVDPALQVNLPLVKNAAAAVVGALDSLAVRAICGKAERIGCDENLVQELGQSAGITKGELEIVSESTATLFMRYPFLAQHAPEFMLVLVAGSVATRYVLVMNRLTEIEIRLKKAQAANAVTPR